MSDDITHKQIFLYKQGVVSQLPNFKSYSEQLVVNPVYSNFEVNAVDEAGVFETIEDAGKSLIKVET